MNTTKRGETSANEWTNVINDIAAKKQTRSRVIVVATIAFILLLTYIVTIN